MSARNRKLVGTIVLVIFLGAYAWVAVEVGAGRISFKPHGALLTLALNSGGARAKRFVKSNPRVYEVAKRMRRALRRNQAAPD